MLIPKRSLIPFEKLGIRAARASSSALPAKTVIETKSIQSRIVGADRVGEANGESWEFGRGGKACVSWCNLVGLRCQNPTGGDRSSEKSTFLTIYSRREWTTRNTLQIMAILVRLLFQLFLSMGLTHEVSSCVPAWGNVQFHIGRMWI